MLTISSDWRDWLFIPLFAQFLCVNLLLYPDYGRTLYEWGTFQLPANRIFPYTWGGALTATIVAAVGFRWKYREDGIRSVAYGIALAFAATSGFELLYQNVGVAAGVGNQSIEGQIINLSAIAVGFSSLRYWRASRPALGAMAAYLSGWLVWLSLGYPQISAVSPTAQVQAYVLNVGLKLGSFALFGTFVAFAKPVDRHRIGQSHHTSPTSA